MNWNKNIFKTMLAVAVRAPSLHNVQPWKARYNDQGFQVFQSTKRRLKIRDSKLHYNDVSMGCFLELCRLFLQRCGLQFTITPSSAEKYLDYESRFNIVLSECETFDDKLYYQIPKRKTFRGKFIHNSSFNESVFDIINVENIQFKLISGSAENKKWAAHFEKATRKINQMPGLFKEHVEWLRFNVSDPRYFQDGLNAESLGLTNTKALFRGILLKPTFLKAISVFGVEKLLITETPQIESAQGLIAIYVKKDLSSIEMGFAFMRFWLQLTSLGIFVCPMTALLDFAETAKILDSMKPGDDFICLNMLRFGYVADDNKVYHSPRLDVSRVII